jgi:hypothetical protein
VKDHGGVDSTLRASLIDAAGVPAKQASELAERVDRLGSR